MSAALPGRCGVFLPSGITARRSSCGKQVFADPRAPSQEVLTSLLLPFLIRLIESASSDEASSAWLACIVVLSIATERPQLSHTTTTRLAISAVAHCYTRVPKPHHS